MLRIALTMALAASASALAAQSPYPHRSFAEKFDCRPTGLPQFVGQMPDANNARQILTVSGAKKLRWVAHGQVVTQEVKKGRVTVQLAADGRIASAVCG